MANSDETKNAAVKALFDVAMNSCASISAREEAARNLGKVDSPLATEKIKELCSGVYCSGGSKVPSSVEKAALSSLGEANSKKGCNSK